MNNKEITNKIKETGKIILGAIAAFTFVFLGISALNYEPTTAQASIAKEETVADAHKSSDISTVTIKETEEKQNIEKQTTKNTSASQNEDKTETTQKKSNSSKNGESTSTPVSSQTSSVPSGRLVYPTKKAVAPEEKTWKTVEPPVDDGFAYYDIELSIYQAFTTSGVGQYQVTVPMEIAEQPGFNEYVLMNYLVILKDRVYVDAGYILEFVSLQTETEPYILTYNICESQVNIFEKQYYAEAYDRYVKTQQLEDLAISIIGSGITEKEAINRLFTWLNNNVTYDYSYASESFSEFGILNRTAVCAGYSLFVCLCMDMYDIPCEYVRGIVSTGNHAWNRIQIDGKWYYIDTTWGYGLSETVWSDHTLI